MINNSTQNNITQNMKDYKKHLKKRFMVLIVKKVNEGGWKNMGLICNSFLQDE